MQVDFPGDHRTQVVFDTGVSTRRLPARLQPPRPQHRRREREHRVASAAGQKASSTLSHTSADRRPGPIRTHTLTAASGSCSVQPKSATIT